jgi:hypothetical protein
MVQGVDVVYPQLYRCMTQLPIATCCTLCTLLYRSRVAVVAVVLATMAWCCAATLLYPAMFGSPHCSVETIGHYRLAIYACVLLCSIVVLAQLKQQPGADMSYWSLYASIGIIAATMLYCAVRCALLSRREKALSDTIDEAKERLKGLQTRLLRDGAMRSPSGRQADLASLAKAWEKKVESSTRCSQLAVMLLALEAQVFTVHLSQVFLSTRVAWERKVRTVIYRVDEDMKIELLPDRDWLTYAFCCGCCDHVCSHRNTKYRDDDDNAAQVEKEDEAIIVLQEVVMALHNAAQPESFLVGAPQMN